MAETIANLEKGGSGGGQIVDYQSMVVVKENGVLNYTPTQDGYLFIMTNPNNISNANLMENGHVFGHATNTIAFPVRSGYTYTTDVSIRMARFSPFV